MPAARPQNLRVLEGRFVLARVTDMRTVAFDADLLALVLGPDGGAAMRRDDTAEDAWVGRDEAADARACYDCGASAGGGWTAASYDGDLVLVPAARLEEAVDVLAGALSRDPGEPPPTPCAIALAEYGDAARVGSRIASTDPELFMHVPREQAFALWAQRSPPGRSWRPRPPRTPTCRSGRPACPVRGRSIPSRSRLGSCATPAPPPASA